MLLENASSLGSVQATHLRKELESNVSLEITPSVLEQRDTTFSHLATICALQLQQTESSIIEDTAEASRVCDDKTVHELKEIQSPVVE